MQVITVTAFYRTVHCSRLHHTCSFLCDLVAAILVLLAVSEIRPLQWWQPNFLHWYMSTEGRKSSRKSSIKSGDFMQQYMSVKCYLHTLLSHKMALALCAQLAHLSVLKLSSELHRGGTGRVQTQTVCTVRCDWLDFHLATNQPIVILDFVWSLPHWPSFKRKEPCTSEVDHWSSTKYRMWNLVTELVLSTI